MAQRKGEAEASERHRSHRMCPGPRGPCRVEGPPPRRRAPSASQRGKEVISGSHAARFRVKRPACNRRQAERGIWIVNVHCMCTRHTYACRLPTQHSLIEEVLLGFGPHSLKALLLATTKHTRLIGRTLHSRTGRGGDDSR